MSGRHDPTAEQAMAFQSRALLRDFQQQRAYRPDRHDRARPPSWRPKYKRRAGAMATSALWRAMHCYGVTEADVRRAA